MKLDKNREYLLFHCSFRRTKKFLLYGFRFDMPEHGIHLRVGSIPLSQVTYTKHAYNPPLVKTLLLRSRSTAIPISFFLSAYFFSLPQPLRSFERALFFVPPFRRFFRVLPPTRQSLTILKNKFLLFFYSYVFFTTPALFLFTSLPPSSPLSALFYSPNRRNAWCTKTQQTFVLSSIHLLSAYIHWQLELRGEKTRNSGGCIYEYTVALSLYTVRNIAHNFVHREATFS